MDTDYRFERLRSLLLDELFETRQIDPGTFDDALSVLVYGVSYRQDVLRELVTVQEQPAICVIRDVGNEHSRHALKVMSNRGKVGYFPDGVAAILSPHLDAGRLQLELVYGEFTRFERDNEDLIGMRIEFRLAPWSDDLFIERD
jgi:hypothetical protein